MEATATRKIDTTQQRRHLRTVELLLDVSRKMAAYDTLDEVLDEAAMRQKKP